MADMPQRPRQHVLESVSRGAFRALAENRGWVVRAVDSPDYGIDDQVEVFSDGGATGLLFYVQVRATDEPDLDKALAVRIRPQQQAYFASIGHPVLVVRYLGESGRLFARWFHRFDAHPLSTTATLRLEESDELTDAAIEALVSEVRLFRTLSSARVSWPLAVKVSSRSRHVAREAAIAMTTIGGGARRYVRFGSAEQSRDTIGLTVDLLKDRMVVHGGRASLTLHGDIDGQHLDDLAPDAVLAVGLVLGSMGHLDAAATLIKASAPVAPGFRDELLATAAATLAGGRRLAEALTIGRDLAKRGRRFEAATLVGLVAMESSELMGDDERASVVAFNENLAGGAETAGESSEAASIWYTLGNWLLFAVKDARRASSAFERAQQLDSSYAEREYFKRELAAALVGAGRYVEAVTILEDLLDSDERRGETLARLADAQLLAGRYSGAASTFSRYLVDADPPEPVWILTAAFARMVVEECGAEQDRRAADARALVARAAAISDENERVAKAREALAMDALCSSAWWLIGQMRMKSDPREAAAPMVAGALGLRSPDLWASTLLVLQMAGNGELAHAAAAYALIQYGASFQNAIRKAGASSGLRDLAELSLALVSEVEETLAVPVDGFTLRVVDKEGVSAEFGFRAREPHD